MIKSFISGRIRFCHPVLKNHAVMEAFTAKIHDLPGFESLTCNEGIGSVTVLYTPDSSAGVTQAQWLRAVLPRFTELWPEKQSPVWALCSTRNYYQLMTLALVLCFVSPALGLIKLHRYSAFALAALIGHHIYTYRKRIF